MLWPSCVVIEQVEPESVGACPHADAGSWTAPRGVLTAQPEDPDARVAATESALIVLSARAKTMAT
jgi:hypothetical protein